MMTCRGLLLHNIVEPPETPGPGLRLQRVPESVRTQLNAVAQGAALGPTCGELRWIGDEVSITLHSPLHHEYVTLHQGDFVVGETCIEPGASHTFKPRPSPAIAAIAQHPAARRRFSPRVWRLSFSGTAGLFLGAVTGDPQPPSLADLPRTRWIAYGSSIVQGFSSLHLADPFVVHAARIAGADVCNLGFGGSCHLEPAMAEWIASRRDWDVAILELGINLLDQPLSDAEFGERCHHLVERVSRDGRPVWAITVPRLSWELDPPPEKRHPERFRQILRQTVARLDRPHLRCIEGPDLLPDLTGLSADGCHPSDHGHQQMGDELARRLMA